MKRRLAAILAADVVGFTALMARDEEGTMKALRDHRAQVFDPITASHEGRIVKLMGDGTLVEFPSVVEAVEAAIAIQNENAARSSEIVLRIGINLGDVMIDGDDIYGDGVNVASRLEALAEPGGIVITSIVHESLGARTRNGFSDGGEFDVKNVATPVRVFRWPAQTVFGEQRKKLVPKELTQGQTITVDRFEHLSSDDELGFFCEGITQDIVTAFGKVQQLIVVSHEHHTEDAPKNRGAHYLLRGNARKAGNRIRVSATLIDQNNGVQIWADRFDHDATDLFDVQDSVARNIVIAVHTNLGAGSYTNRWQWGTEDFAAWQIMAIGFHEFQKFSPESFEKAVQSFEQALAIDPNYAAPLLASAYCYGHLAWIVEDDAAKVLIAKAQSAVDRAERLIPDDVRRFAAIRAIEIAKGDYDKALEAARTALETAPHDSYTRATMAYALMCTSRPEEALSQAAKAEREMPSTPGWFDMAKVLSLIMLGTPSEALRITRDATTKHPDLYPLCVLHVALSKELGQEDECGLAKKALKQMDPQFSARRFVSWCGMKDQKHRDMLFEMLVNAGLEE